MLNIIPRPKSAKQTGIYSKVDLPSIEYIPDDSIKPEGYILSVKPEGVIINYSDEDGKYYALLTLKHLITADGTAPQCEINDEPRFGYRAFMLDSSRHMPSVDEIKRFVRTAALFKFNYFHWHLSDDQGFRVESEKYPLLNEIGSWRDRAGFGSDSEEIYGGYYTKDEIRSIVDLCSSLHIQVIPELDMPGHTSSWLASYPDLGCGREKVSTETTNGVKNNILCAGRDETYEFCKNLVDEVAELFPCEYFHIGGDEVPKDTWKACPDCQAKIKAENLKNENALQDHFTSVMAAHLKSIGKTPIVWNDALSSVLLPEDIVVANWSDPLNKTASFANKGGRVIAENTSNNYLDYSYSMLSLKKCYDFGVYPVGIKSSAKKNFIGVEAPLWSEWIPDFDRLCYQAFPRLMAVAEVAWTDPDLKDYASFKSCIKSYYDEMKENGVYPACEDHWDPSPAVKIQLDKEWAAHSN